MRCWSTRSIRPKLLNARRSYSISYSTAKWYDSPVRNSSTNTVAWDNIVTKDYLDARLERQDRTLDHQMALLRADMETLEQRVIAEFRHEWRTSLLAIVSTAMVVAGAFVAAGRLA